MFCIIKGIDDLDFGSFFKYSHYHTTCQHHYKLYPAKLNKKIGPCSFSSRVVSPWIAIVDKKKDSLRLGLNTKRGKDLLYGFMKR